MCSFALGSAPLDLNVSRNNGHPIFSRLHVFLLQTLVKRQMLFGSTKKYLLAILLHQYFLTKVNLHTV